MFTWNLLLETPFETISVTRQGYPHQRVRLVGLSLIVHRTLFLQSIERNVLEIIYFSHERFLMRKANVGKLQSWSRDSSNVTTRCVTLQCHEASTWPHFYTPPTSTALFRAPTMSSAWVSIIQRQQCFLLPEPCSLGKQWRFRNPLPFMFLRTAHYEEPAFPISLT